MRIAILVVLLAYITWYRVCRRAEWFFLRWYVIQNPRLALVLGDVFSRALRRRVVATEVTVSTYPRPGYGVFESTDRCKTLYWEAPLAVAVWLEGKPLFGIALEFRSGALCIRQLQGVRGARIPRKLITISRVLVKACVSFARLSGTREVRLYKADQSLFYHFPDLHLQAGESHACAVRAHQQRMRQRYDETAKDLGFSEHPRWYSWRNPHYTRL